MEQAQVYWPYLPKNLGQNIVAIDNDEWSVTNALENIESNKCRQIAVIKTDRFKAETKTDIILANINFTLLRPICRK